MLVLLAELVGPVSHVGHYLQSEFLCFLAFSVVLAHECDEAFCQSDEPYSEGTLVDDWCYGVVGIQFLAVYPQALHEQGELLGERRLLELHAVV